MSISSYELTEWQAFEKAHGPLGREYSDVILASVHEQLQFGTYVTGMQFGKDNPAPKPQHYPRPDQVFKPRDESDPGLSREEFDSLF